MAIFGRVFDNYESIAIFIWGLYWSIVGIIGYQSKLSTECQDESIGQMLFAWSVIKLIGLAGLTLFICGACVYSFYTIYMSIYLA